MLPSISVIIPVYNAHDYLEHCIRSVLTQSLENIEVLCIDDGSTDDSLQILHRLAAEDKRIKVIEQANKSAGAARNLGLRRAVGKYVHFLDADDWLEQGIYAHAVDILERTGAQVCAFQYWVYDNSRSVKRPFPCYLNGRERVTFLDEEPALLLYNSVVPWNKMCCRDWLIENGLKFDEIKCANDRAFYFKLLRTGARIALTMRKGLFYRVQNMSSLTGTTRFINFDCLIKAWESAKSAYDGAAAAQRAMLMDTCVQNFLEVLHMAPEPWKTQIFKTLHDYFQTFDVSVLAELPFPCLWKDEYEEIRRAESYADMKIPEHGKLETLKGKVRIWGVRGCAVKVMASLHAREHRVG